MSGLPAIGAVQAGTPSEAWQAWLQASLPDALPTLAPAEPMSEAPAVTAPAAPSPSSPAASEAASSPWLAAEPASALVLLAPVVRQPLQLPHGTALHWRVTDAPAWQVLFDDAAPEGTGEGAADGHAEADTMTPAATATPVPAWAQALLARLRAAAAAPATAAVLRPAVQAWCVGLPVLLASPSGLASLQASRDASVWQWRRWPAQWRTARPATEERWWAVRLGLGLQGQPRTLRELGMSTPQRLGPGQVSCELRLGDAPHGIANWAVVLVQAPAAASLRSLLAARPSLTWLLCSHSLWPQEGP